MRQPDPSNFSDRAPARATHPSQKVDPWTAWGPATAPTRDARPNRPHLGLPRPSWAGRRPRQAIRARAEHRPARRPDQRHLRARPWPSRRSRQKPAAPEVPIRPQPRSPHLSAPDLGPGHLTSQKAAGDEPQRVGRPAAAAIFLTNPSADPTPNQRKACDDEPACPSTGDTYLTDPSASPTLTSEKSPPASHDRPVCLATGAIYPADPASRPHPRPARNRRSTTGRPGRPPATSFSPAPPAHLTLAREKSSARGPGSPPSRPGGKLSASSRPIRRQHLDVGPDPGVDLGPDGVIFLTSAPGAGPAAPRNPAGRNPESMNFSDGPGCPIDLRSQKSCPQSPTSGRPGPLSPCATPGDEAAHIWG